MCTGHEPTTKPKDVSTLQVGNNLYCIAVKLGSAQLHLEGLLTHRFLGPTCRVSGHPGLGWGPENLHL